MSSAKVFIVILFSFYILIILVAHVKSKKFLISVFLTTLQGLCSLFAVNLLGQYISVHIPVNIYTLGVSTLGGVSGVIMMLLCDVFMI